jgi:two-component system LytT family response regulator
MERYIARVPFLERVASFDNAIEARDYLSVANAVDIIFVDINMPELSGVDFVRSLVNPPMVIFATAYSEYAIEGFKLDAIDYLLKPISFEAFERAATKAHSVAELRALRDGVKSDSVPEGEQSSEKECISIRADHKTSLVRFSNIVYLESAGEYVRLHIEGSSTITTLFRLKNMETTLPAESFLRVHRSYIINLKRIASYTKGRIFLDNGEYIPLGENYKERFLEYFNKHNA